MIQDHLRHLLGILKFLLAYYLAYEPSITSTLFKNSYICSLKEEERVSRFVFMYRFRVYTYVDLTISHSNYVHSHDTIP